MTPKRRFLNPHHWFWEWAYVLSVFAVFTWRLNVNATRFDSTEIAVIVESGVWAVAAVGLLMWLRRRHNNLFNNKREREIGDM